MLKDFKFIGKDINEKEIQEMSKELYKKTIKELVRTAALKSLLDEKVSHSKLDEVKYDKLQTQPYLTERRFSSEERKLLALLRSRCFGAKSNFKKLWRGNLGCSLGCPSNEDQNHIFTQCIWLNSPTETQY